MKKKCDLRYRCGNSSSPNQRLRTLRLVLQRAQQQTHKRQRKDASFVCGGLVISDREPRSLPSFLLRFRFVSFNFSVVQKSYPAQHTFSTCSLWNVNVLTIAPHTSGSHRKFHVSHQQQRAHIPRTSTHSNIAECNCTRI